MKKSNIYLGVVLLLALVVRLWNVVSFDLYSDSSLYSFRSLGLFDYIGGGQTTPIQWFGSIPAWASLSFHDAPPLVFWIQHFFFVIFGDTTFAARIPFVLVGVVATYFLYKWLFKVSNERVAIISSLIFALMSYSVWAGRVGYLEGITLCFVVICCYFLNLFLKEPTKHKYLYFMSIFLGLSLLTKYTAIFLFPVIFFSLLIYRKEVFQKEIKLHFKPWLISLFLLIMVLAPVIIYNCMVYSFRGHFDAALSSMLGIKADDFSTLASRSMSITWNKLFAPLITISQVLSLPFFILFIISLLGAIIKLVRKKLDKANVISLLGILSLTVMFIITGSEVRFLPIFIPFVAVLVGNFIYNFIIYLNRYKIIKVISIIVITCVLSFEIFYSINTNIVRNPKGAPGIFYSETRFYDRGWNSLENYLKLNIFPKDINISNINSLEDLNIGANEIKGRQVVFCDDRVDWFAYSWYIQKYRFYYKLPIFPVSMLLKDKDAFSSNISQLNKAGAGGYVFIYAKSDLVMSSGISERASLAIDSFATGMEKGKIGYEDIMNYQGETAFRVFKIK